MLKSIIIHSLYGLYSYEIPIKLGNDSYKFITASNGYGKTTLLKMLDYLYNMDFSSLSKIRFDLFELLFEDGCRISINQVRFFSDDMESDEEGPVRVQLLISTSFGENTMWSSDAPHDIEAQNLNHYLNSHPVFFIKDDRMVVQSRQLLTDRINVAQFRAFLLEMSQSINSSLVMSVDATQQTMTESEYSNELTVLKPTIEALLKYDIIKRNPIPDYSETNSAICRSSIEALKYALNPEIKRKLSLVVAFDKIIGMYQFSNKYLEISPLFGYRFKATDDIQSILSFNELSSGERHILLINYDLLFNAPDDSLVLIDEPEMSFHLEWQGLFMENLINILSARELQCIICTHSPEMFGYQWDRSVDLYELSQEFKEVQA